MMSRVVSVVLIALITAGCAPDPPRALVEVLGTGCGPQLDNGVGSYVDNGLVLTSAHIVAGAEDIFVATIDGQLTAATIVGFDPRNDLAYLQAEPYVGGGLKIATAATLDQIERGTVGYTYVWRDGAPIREQVVIERRLHIDTEDIYVDAKVTRPGWEITYPIQPGDSGAPVIVNGEVIGVVWARSTQTDGRAYAIDPLRGGDIINQHRRDGIDDSVDITRCF